MSIFIIRYDISYSLIQYEYYIVKKLFSNEENLKVQRSY